jgi:hypothetical protein
MKQSILQEWVMELGLRHQGVLLGAIRGCDTVPKEDPAKHLVRCLRAEVLNAHCGDAAKAKTFMEGVTDAELRKRMDDFFKYGFDHYPNHYVIHFLHAAEILGYKHESIVRCGIWREFYLRFVKKLHLSPETEAQLDERLNKNEHEFFAAQ